MCSAIIFCQSFWFNQVQDWVSVFELNLVAREKLMVSLLGSFDSRTWVNISGIILRLVRGGGFGQVGLP